MDPIFLIIIIFLLILTGLKYFEHSFCLDCSRFGRAVVSFVTGAAIVTVFLELFDDIYVAVHRTDPMVGLVLPAAFVVLFLIEKHILHHRNERLKFEEQRFLVRVISFLAGVLVGIIAISNPQDTIFHEVIFMSLLVSYDLMREISLHVMHGAHRGRYSLRAYLERILTSLSPFFGFFTAYFFRIPDILNAVLLSVFGGAVIYALMREVLPREKKIYSLSFLSGVGFLMVIFAANML